MVRIDRLARVILAAGAASAVVAGCGGPPAEAPAPPAPPRVAVKLVVQVLGDEPLAAGVKLLRGEWEARSGGDLLVEVTPLKHAGSVAAATGDVVIFPSRLLGELAESGALQPVRANVLESRDFALADIYPAIRTGEMRYGDATLALPLGSPPLLACRAAKADDKAPRWALPLAGRDAAHVLLVRALNLIDRNARAEALFDADRMTPRIAEPPFERALAQIVADAKTVGGDPPRSFAECVRLVQRGDAHQAYGWPGLLDRAGADGLVDVHFERIGAADEVYAGGQGEWEPSLAPVAVTYLGAAGRLVGVGAKTHNAVTALRFCQWLTSGDAAVQVSPRSSDTAWFRLSQSGRAGEWLRTAGDRGAGQGALQAVAELLESETPFVVPRLPGIDEYLAELGDAVQQAVSGGQTPKAALEAAADQWEAITNQRGRDAQRRAYRRHLGLDAFSRQ